LNVRERPTARVVLVDDAGRVLLMKGRLPSDPGAPGVWFSLGGGIETGETAREAAAREVVEETGFRDVAIGAQIFEAEHQRRDRKGRPLLIRETWFLARCSGGAPSTAGWQPLEHAFIDDIRWWSLADLAASVDPTFPADLAEKLANWLAAPR